MRPDDIKPDEEILPPNRMWYQRKGCLAIIAVVVLLLALVGFFVWQVNKYYKAIKTGSLTPAMMELAGKVVSDDEILNDIVTVDDDPSMGPEDAKVQVIMFEDFQCPYCGQTYQTIRRIMNEYKDQVLFVYRDFPTGHEFSQMAAEAGECADDQGYFWQYHDLLFANQDLIIEKTVFGDFAQQLGLNTEEFQQCLDSEKHKEEVTKDYLDGTLAGVEGTPTYFINGYKMQGVFDYEFWRQSMDYLLEEINKQ